MATGEEFGLGNPNAIFVPPQLKFGNWNNHHNTN